MVGSASALVAMWCGACTDPNERPSNGNDVALAYDSARHELVLYETKADPDSETSTWTWNGRAWTDVTPAVSPMGGAVMAYDPQSETVILASRQGRETWSWNGVRWKVEDDTSMRIDGVAYDSTRGRLVGVGSGTTYEWEGARWHEENYAGRGSLSYGPPPAMAYDSSAERMVVVGPDAAYERVLLTPGNAGVHWVDLEGTKRPAFLPYEGAMVYDEARQRLVLFGGAASTWEWDGAQWLDVSPPGESPPGGLRVRMAYEADREKVVLFGGHSSENLDVWEWDGTSWLRR
jgi:hypothetical protein